MLSSTATSNLVLNFLSKSCHKLYWLIKKRYIMMKTPSKSPRIRPRNLRRALGYVKHYPKVMGLAYGALLIATLAQLAVPTLIRNIIDTITNGVIAQKILQTQAALQPLIEQKI